ncbi:MAG: M28 family peptidase [Desulfobacterales bacterium]|nr:M28 family peptidase [Desulfobacterales bacterium]
MEKLLSGNQLSIPEKEIDVIKTLIEKIIQECPRRQSASKDERKAQLIMKDVFERLGLNTHEESFLFSDNLYANMTLHFGVGTLGTIVSCISPFLGFMLHMSAGISYYAESTRQAYLLRRLFPFKPSQNLMAEIPAKDSQKLRIVFLAHADAAFTGLLFQPFMIKSFSGNLPPKLRFLKRSMALTTYSLFALAGFDILRMALGPLTWPLRPIEYILTIPTFLAFVLNFEVIMRNKVVPGANDDLSGVAALAILAKRFMEKKYDNVEFIFGVTGCEEASLGGGDALAKVKQGVWDKEKTVVIGLDGISGGTLRYFEVEGEVVPTPIPNWLKDVADETSSSEDRFKEVTGFEVPVGGSDIAAFLARGYDGVCLGCVNPKIGAPDYYHTVNDSPENLDYEKILFSVDFIEKLTDNIIKYKIN